MLSPDQIQSFRENGFVRGPKILSDEQIETLKAETLRVIDDREDASKPQPTAVNFLSGDSAHPVWQLVNIHYASDAFSALVHNPQLAAMLGQIFPEAEQMRLWHDQIQYKPPRKGGPAWWHQDSPYWPCLQPKDQQVTAWVALDDVDEGNGCMSMVRGSHKWGDVEDRMVDHGWYRDGRDFFDLPDSFEGHAIEHQLCPVRAGEVHFHHVLTWHGSHANHSGRPRRALAMHFMTDQTRFDDNGRAHPCVPLVREAGVADGERIAGDPFPLVYERDAAVESV